MIRSSEEFEANYISIMGTELGLLYSRLTGECTVLHATWGEYLVLFGTDEETVQLLNRAAPTFTGMIQNALWENILLHVCRLVDRTSTLKKENLTILRLPVLVEGSLKPQLNKAIDAVISQSQFAKDWRDRRIAHSDFELSMGSSAKSLAAASRFQVKEALQGIADVLNLVEMHYTGSTNLWGVICPANGAALLIDVLKDGLKAGDARRERLRNHCPLPQDFD